MRVRRFEGRADVPGIIRVHTASWRAAYDGLLPEDVLDGLAEEPTDEDVERWLEGLEANADGVLVGLVDDAVRGFADIRWGDVETKAFVGEDEAGLRAIYVDPEHWGEGLGTVLLERGIEVLPVDVEALRLEMLAGNDVGHRFYEARGFELTGTTEFEIGGEAFDSVIYSRAL